jgi:hypothetical protein
MSNNWLEIAKRKWTTHCIGGSGRFALYSPSMGPLSKILLCETRAEAEAQIVDPKECLIVDLAFAEKHQAELEAQAEREERRQQKKLNDLRAVGFAK